MPLSFQMNLYRQFSIVNARQQEPKALFHLSSVNTQVIA